MRYLLDTNIIVRHLRGDRSMTEQIRSRRDEGLAVSVISIAELYEGVFRDSNPEQAEGVVKEF